MAYNRRRTIMRQEGNPSRIEQLRRYNEAAKGGFTATVNDPVAQANWYAGGGGIAGDPTQVYVDTPNMLARPGNPNQNFVAQDAYANGPGTARGDILRPGQAQDEFNAWVAAHTPKPKPPPSPLDAFSRMYDEAGIEAAIRSGYGGQTAAVNDAYNSALARLASAQGSAELGVRQEGTQLQQGLGALGQDAITQFANARRGIVSDFRQGRQAVNKDTAALLRDIRTNGGGAGAQALAEQAGVIRAASKGSQADQAGLNDRYSQLLAQELNNRQAAGKTITSGSIGDIARAALTARANAEQARASGLAQISGNEAQQLAAAKIDQAKAKYSFLTSVARGSAGSGRTLTASAKAAADKIWGPDNYAGAFKGVLSYRDPGGDQSKTDAIRLAGSNLLDELAGGKNPLQIEAEYNAGVQSGDLPDVPEIRLAIASAKRQAAAKIRQGRQAVSMSPQERQYLRSLGYNV